MNNELERIWKDTVVTLYILSQNLFGGTEENLRIGRVLTEIRMQRLPNTSLVLYL
jgi:hypothetical protein